MRRVGAETEIAMCCINMRMWCPACSFETHLSLDDPLGLYFNASPLAAATQWGLGRGGEGAVKKTRKEKGRITFLRPLHRPLTPPAPVSHALESYLWGQKYSHCFNFYSFFKKRIQLHAVTRNYIVITAADILSFPQRLLYLPIPSSAETWKIVTKKVCQFVFAWAILSEKNPYFGKHLFCKTKTDYAYKLRAQDFATSRNFSFSQCSKQESFVFFLVKVIL